MLVACHIYIFNDFKKNIDFQKEHDSQRSIIIIKSTQLTSLLQTEMSYPAQDLSNWNMQGNKTFMTCPTYGFRPGVSKPDLRGWADPGASDIACALQASCCPCCYSWQGPVVCWCGHTLPQALEDTVAVTCYLSSILIASLLSHFFLLLFFFGWRKTWIHPLLWGDCLLHFLVSMISSWSEVPKPS